MHGSVMAVGEAELGAVRAAMRACPPRVPGHHDKVHKDECAFSFDTPLSDMGLYINLSTWQAVSQAYIGLDHQRTGNRLYLNEHWYKVPVPEDVSAKADAKANKLAIGGEGGFQVGGPKYDIEKTRSLVIMPEIITIPLPCPQLPELVLNAINGIIAHDSAHSAEEVAHWEEDRRTSRYAHKLPQLEAGLGKFGRHIPSDPRQWHCDETGVTDNLWLNLSTGFIGSGRQNWDGSGGNGAALRHFEATGKKYPLVVKLGTITPHGADVFSYAPDEGDMVLDPHLAEHLKHWGINMLSMEKTTKSMAELQIDLNMSFDFDKITESGTELEPLTGPGLVGLKNLGNSCYMNSVMQLLLTVPQVHDRYVKPAGLIFSSAPTDMASDFPTQMAKLGSALSEGKTATPEAPVPMDLDASRLQSNGLAETNDGMWVTPTAFKLLVGRNHPEFSSARQQDAMEYFQHLLEYMSRCERSAAGRLGEPMAPPTADAFRFEVEDRIQCTESKCVSYKRSSTNVLGLDIPLQAATNKEELEDFQERQAKRTKLREPNMDANDALTHAQPETFTASANGFIEACLDSWMAPEQVDGYLSAALGRRTCAIKRDALASFPPFLLIQLRRYYVAEDWTPKKLEVLVDVPEHLDVTHLRATGPQPHEQLQPDVAQQVDGAAAADGNAASTDGHASTSKPQPDPDIVAALTGMGFSDNGSKRAALATQNAGTEASMEWVFAHMEDADFNDPLPNTTDLSSDSARPPASTANPEYIMMLTSMGFTSMQASAALQACGSNLERAGDWLFSHADDLDTAVASVGGQAASNPPAETSSAGNLPRADDGPGKYDLVGFISHVGSNTACGHYVCHIKKDGRWVIFNDEKVAVSQNPPKELGYLYLFKRQET